MKKVGIVTWYWGNYGSILQAYALQKSIQSFGYDCEVIRHSVKGKLSAKIKYRLSHVGLSSTSRFYYNKIKTKLCSGKQKKLLLLRNICFNRFIEKNICLSDTEYNNSNYSNCTEYDIFVCGSDQIWNPDFTFLSPYYWLYFVPEEIKTISYAPSMGSAKITDKERNIIEKYLRRLNYISVREKKSELLLKTFTPDLDIKTVCDPTFLLPTDSWKQIVPQQHSEKKYLFAYLIRGNKKQREFISKIAKEYNLTLVVYPLLEGNQFEKDELSWGDIQCYDDDPAGFLNKIMYADFIITDSFHCTVFSIRFHKEFYVLKKTDDVNSQFDRLDNLLKSCKKEDRIIDENKKFTRTSCVFDETDVAVKKIVQNGLGYLITALER